MPPETTTPDPNTTNQGDPAGGGGAGAQSGDPTGTTTGDPSTTATAGTPAANTGDGDLVAKLRKIEKEQAAKIAKLEKAQTDAERAKLDEVDRIKAESADKDALLEKWKGRVRDAAVESALTRAGVDPDVADLAAAAAAKGVTVEDDGTVTGVADAIEQLQKDRPKLFGSSGDGGGSGTAGGGAAGAGSINAGAGQGGTPGPNLTADEIAMAEAFKLTPEQYAANKSIIPTKPTT